MLVETNGNAIIEMTEKLCETILEQPEYKNVRDKIDAFSLDDEAKSQYQAVYEQQTYLQEKQQQGLQVTEEESANFRKAYQALLNNERARGFIEAQQAVEEVEETIAKYVSYTLKNGQVPQLENLSSSSCACGGSGCGCGGH